MSNSLYIIFTLLLIFSCAKLITFENFDKDIINKVGLLNLVDEAHFKSPLIDICLENSNFILILDNSGERIFRIPIQNFSQIETIILPNSVSFLKGIESDGFFWYLFTNSCIYRYDPIRRRIFNLTINRKDIYISDFFITKQGEIFICDEYANSIYLIDNLGNLKEVTLQYNTWPLKIKHIAYDNVANFLWIYNYNQNRWEKYLRNGTLSNIIRLNKNFSDHFEVYDNELIVIDRQSNQLLLFSEKYLINYPIISNLIIRNFTKFDNYLFLLTHNRIQKYLIITP